MVVVVVVVGVHVLLRTYGTVANLGSSVTLLRKDPSSEVIKLIIQALSCKALNLVHVLSLGDVTSQQASCRLH